MGWDPSRDTEPGLTSAAREHSLRTHSITILKYSDDRNGGAVTNIAKFLHREMFVPRCKALKHNSVVLEAKHKI